jgi:hypothetical protein
MSRQTADVTWQDARTAALKILERAGAKKGDMLLVPDFDSDEDCRFFSAADSLAYHRMILKAAGRVARREGIKMVRHRITPSEYREHLKKERLADFPEERIRFFYNQAKVVR